ncbi:MAG: O-antigen ligase family protein [Paludibacteraceae bacterium]|nr:O-antigen ligase family protein [Paludibacteraceae bacterium]MBQ9296488.1 O-antigen ligase family protein [Paludibacteraceae bacterium]
MKRGAIFVASICLIPFVLQSIKQGNSKQRIVFSIAFLAFIVVGIYFIQYMLNTSEYFITRINDTLEGNSSLRDSLYAELWKYFINQDSIIEMFFGGGANKTIYIVGNYAHNDWLEILINQGLIGILIYFIYWIALWKTYKSCRNIPELNTARNGILICFIASLLMTLFSMSYSNLSIGLTMTLGLCLGKITLYRNDMDSTHE